MNIFPDEETCRALLVAHGYDPDLDPRGVAGPPGEFDGFRIEDGRAVKIKLRNWVCVLDGAIIDGHADPDNTGMCIHCLQEY